MLQENYNTRYNSEELEINAILNSILNEIFNKKEITIKSYELLKLLNFLTSEKNISHEITTAVEQSNIRISKILHENELEYYRKKIKYYKQLILEKDNEIIKLNKIIDEEF